MKRRSLICGAAGFLVLLAAAGVWWFVDHAPSETEDQVAAADQPYAIVENGDPWTTLSAKELARLLKGKVAWARGRSPDELINAIHLKGQELHSEPWHYDVVEAALTDTYGNQAQKILGESGLELYQDKGWMTKPLMARDKVNDSESDLQRNRILELARTHGAEALRQVNRLVDHPQTIESLCIEVLGEYAQSKPLQALALLNEQDNVDVGDARAAIFRSWARHDPQSSLAYLAQFPPSQDTEILRSAVIRVWSEQDMLGALEAAITSPINDTTNRMLQRMVTEYLEQEPESAVPWILGQDVVDPSLLEPAIHHLAKTRPIDAFHLMQNKMPYDKQRSVMSGIMTEWAKNEPYAAWRWTQSLPDGELKANSQSCLLSRMGESDPDTVVAIMTGGAVPGLERINFQQVIFSLSRHHPEKALQLANALPSSPLRAYAFEKSVSALIGKDPGRAGEFLAQMNEDPYIRELSGEILESWAGSDFEAATDWMKNNASLPAMENVTEAMAEDWLRKDMQGALEFGAKLPPGRARSTLAHTFVRNYAKRDLKRVVDWFNAIEPDPKTDIALYHAFSDGGAIQQEEAKRLIRTMPRGETRDRALNGMASSLSRKSNQQASYWVAQQDFSSEKHAQSAMNCTLGQWHRKDPEAATSWALALPGGVIKSAAAASIATEVAKSDPTRATLLVRAVRDPGTRKSLSCDILRDLPDSNARVRFINQLALAPDETNALLKYVDSRGP